MFVEIKVINALDAECDNAGNLTKNQLKKAAKWLPTM